MNASKPPHIVRFALLTWANKILHRVVRVPDLCPGLTPPGPLSRHGGQTFLSTHSCIVLSLQALFMWQLQQCPLVWLLRNLLSLSYPSIFLGYPVLPKLSSPWGDAAKFSQQCVCVRLCQMFSLCHSMCNMMCAYKCNLFPIYIYNYETFHVFKLYIYLIYAYTNILD